MWRATRRVRVLYRREVVFVRVADTMWLFITYSTYTRSVDQITTAIIEMDI